MEREAMTTCPDCDGTGGGHPDDFGYRCSTCGGSGGVSEAPPVPIQSISNYTVQQALAAFKAAASLPDIVWAQQVEIMRLRAERNDLRKLLVDLGAGIPASAILKAEHRDD
jgi:hypothetical protein